MNKNSAKKKIAAGLAVIAIISGFGMTSTIDNTGFQLNSITASALSKISVSDINVLQKNATVYASGINVNYSGSVSGYIKGYYGISFSLDQASALTIKGSGTSSTIKNLYVVDSSGNIKGEKALTANKTSAIDISLSKGTYYVVYEINNSSGAVGFSTQLNYTNLLDISRALTPSVEYSETKDQAVLSYSYNGKKLVNGKDYTIVSSSPRKVVNGDETVYYITETIKGIGSYTGNATIKDASVTIYGSSDPEDTGINIADKTNTAVTVNYANNAPSLIVKYKGTTLKSGTDYTLSTSYKDTNASNGYISRKYTFTITGKGSYSGEYQVTATKILIPVTLVTKDEKFKSNKVDVQFVNKSNTSDTIKYSTTDRYIIPPTALKDGATYSLLISSNGFVSRTFNAKRSGTTVSIEFTDGLNEIGKLYLKGDINGDGTLNTQDLLLVKRHIIGYKTLNRYQFRVGDINSNQKINTQDLLLIKRHLMGVKTLW